MLVTNLSVIEFQVRYFVLFPLFSVINSFRWFWMGILLKNIQLILEFLKASFLILNFSYLMTFLTMLSVILLSVLMILDWGRKWLVDFKSGKIQLVLFNQCNHNGAIDVKMDSLVLEEKSLLKKSLLNPWLIVKM